MVRIHVLDQHENHSGIGGESREKRCECFQTAGRGPNADDGKGGCRLGRWAAHAGDFVCD
jgi:hypothetical protein